VGEDRPSRRVLARGPPVVRPCLPAVDDRAAPGDRTTGRQRHAHGSVWPVYRDPAVALLEAQDGELTRGGPKRRRGHEVEILRRYARGEPHLLGMRGDERLELRMKGRVRLARARLEQPRAEGREPPRAAITVAIGGEAARLSIARPVARRAGPAGGARREQRAVACRRDRLLHRAPPGGFVAVPSAFTRWEQFAGAHRHREPHCGNGATSHAGGRRPGHPNEPTPRIAAAQTAQPTPRHMRRNDAESSSASSHHVRHERELALARSPPLPRYRTAMIRVKISSGSPTPSTSTTTPLAW
jgi:hypothetical protein